MSLSVQDKDLCSHMDTVINYRGPCYPHLKQYDTQRNKDSILGISLALWDIFSCAISDTFSSNRKSFTTTHLYFNQQLLVHTLKTLEQRIQEDPPNQIRSRVPEFCCAALTSEIWRNVYKNDEEYEMVADVQECEQIANARHSTYHELPEFDFVEYPLDETCEIARRILYTHLEQKNLGNDVHEDDLSLKTVVDNINTIYQSIISGGDIRCSMIDENALEEGSIDPSIELMGDIDAQMSWGIELARTLALVQKTVEIATRLLEEGKLELEYEGESGTVTTPPLDCFAVRVLRTYSPKIGRLQSKDKVLNSINRLLLKTLPVRSEVGPLVHSKEETDLGSFTKVLLW